MESNLQNISESETIFIKTYAHESGLFYLGLSLAKTLKKLGFNPIIIPKAKYIKKGVVYCKEYLPFASFDIPILNIEKKDNLSEKINISLKEYKANTIISFETLMEKSGWVNDIKKANNVKIIDVPMLEWVTPKYFNAGKYEIFNEIWTLTNVSNMVFKNQGYKNVVNKRWPFVDGDIFYPGPKLNEKVKFYHQASLNVSHSTKNTEQVIEAFAYLIEKMSNVAQLTISGILDSNLLNKIKLINRDSENVICFNRVLSRNEVGCLYRETDCVIAPSSREGLCLSLFEAKASGCKIITTNAPPMNEVETEYLCEYSDFIRTNSLVPNVKITKESIYNQMKKVCEEVIACQKTLQ